MAIVVWPGRSWRSSAFLLSRPSGASCIPQWPSWAHSNSIFSFWAYTFCDNGLSQLPATTPAMSLQEATVPRAEVSETKCGQSNPITSWRLLPGFAGPGISFLSSPHSSPFSPSSPPPRPKPDRLGVGTGLADSSSWQGKLRYIVSAYWSCWCKG